MSKNITSYIMPTYGKRTLEFLYGKGAYLYSKDRKKYLDFGSGIAVTSLGHCHPVLIKAINKQTYCFLALCFIIFTIYLVHYIDSIYFLISAIRSLIVTIEPKASRSKNL